MRLRVIRDARGRAPASSARARAAARRGAFHEERRFDIARVESIEQCRRVVRRTVIDRQPDFVRCRFESRDHRPEPLRVRTERRPEHERMRQRQDADRDRPPWRKKHQQQNRDRAACAKKANQRISARIDSSACTNAAAQEPDESPLRRRCRSARRRKTTPRIAPRNADAATYERPDEQQGHRTTEMILM